MKYKVEDEVKIREDLVAGCVLGFVEEMEFYTGKTYKIVAIDKEVYHLDNCRFVWTDEMLEEKVEKENKEYTIQEVLVEDNIGKKFECKGRIYEVDHCLDLIGKDCGQIEEPREFKDRIKKGDRYYFIDLDERREFVFGSRFDNDYMDKYRMERNNFFETRAEAEENLKEILKVLES